MTPQGTNDALAGELFESFKGSKITRRQFVRLVGLTGASAMALSLLAACGGDDDDDVTSSATSTVMTSNASSPESRNNVAPAGPADGIARVLSGTEPVNFDPGIASLASAMMICKSTYDGLFRFDGWERQDHLCERAEVSEDGLTATLSIRQGVRFHDGSEMKGSDVVYSFVRMLEMSGPLTLLWSGIVKPANVTLVDDYTVQIKTERPYGPLLDTLAWMWVVNEEVVEANVQGDDYGSAYLNQTDAGTGPFKITSFSPGERLVLERFPDYWRGWGDKYLNGWTMEVVREPATLQLMMQQGQGHLVDLWSLPVTAHESLEKSGATTLYEFPIPSIVAMMMNCQKWPTSNKDFRKACAYAFDYDAVIKGLLNDRSDYVLGAIAKEFQYFLSFEGNEMLYRKDLDRAKMHLQRSGFDPASEVLAVNYRSYDDTQRDYSLVLQSSLEAIGIRLGAEGVTGPVFSERQKSPDLAVHFNRISGRGLTSAPDLYMREFYHSASWEGNRGYWATMAFYKNEQVDDLLDRARVSIDEDERRELFHEAQQIVYDDVPHIWVDQQHWIVSLNKSLKGFQPQPIGGITADMYPLYFEG